MRLAIIAAIDSDNGIGVGGKLPWYSKADLKYFRAKTLGCRVIMGRKTFESLPVVLIDRDVVVISSVMEPTDKVTVCETLTEALELPEYGKGEVFCIGGAQLFKEAIGIADVMYITRINGDYDCDTFFPFFSERSWEVVEHYLDKNVGLTRITYRRR